MQLDRFFLVFIVLLILFFPIALAQEDSLLPLQGIAKKNGVKLSSGNIVVEIYDSPTSGNLLYNSTTDFSNVISGGEYDIILGNGSQPLSLNYGQRYYMDMYLNGVDMDFNGSERKVFMSNVGNISTATPLHTNSTDADDALNISRGGTFLSGNVSINGTFNVTALNGTARIAGGVTILDGDVDSALNVSSGGAFIGGNTVFNNFFNITTTTSAVRTNGTVTILSTLSPALSIVSGFNVSGSNAALSTNGTVTMGSTAVIQSTDADDALNVSNGGGNFRGQLGVQNYTSSPAFTVNYGFNVSGSSSALSTNGTISILSLLSPALLINGFNVSGASAALSTNGSILVNNLFNVTASNGNTDIGGALDVDGAVTLNSRASPAFSVNSGFNISGANSALSTNGTITILSLLGPAFTINYGFNISGTSGNLRTNGTIAIFNPDVDDALNITSGGTSLRGNLTVGLRDGGSAGVFVNEQGSILVGNASSTNEPNIKIFDGGTDNCGYLVLYDENGEPHYLYVATTGELMINTGQPSTCANTDGTKVGTQT